MKQLVIMTAVVVAGCGNFEDPAVVLDLRTLAMVANPTEYVIPFDPANPPDPSQVHLGSFEVDALVADPGVERPLQWEMTLCAATVDQGDGRCSDGHPATVIGSGIIEDPDLGADINATIPRAVFQPIGSTFVLLQDAIERDPFAGFSGIDLEVMLQVAPIDQPLAKGATATKRVRFAAKIPADRTPNRNPSLTRIDWDTGGPTPITQPISQSYMRCIDFEAIEIGGGPWLGMTMFTNQVLSMMPVEPGDARETYVVPTFDGTSRMFTENLSYQWLAGDGSYVPPFTGGPKDPFGNDPPLHTEWTPPTMDDIARDYGDVPYIDVAIWVVQRDERLGAAWFQGCVRVFNDVAPSP